MSEIGEIDGASSKAAPSHATATKSTSTASGTAARRPGTAAKVAAGSRPSSTSRTTGSAMSKPPARPAASSTAAHRPAAASSTTLHRPRPSLSGDEKKTGASSMKAARRTSTLPGSATSSPSRERKLALSTVAASTAAARKPAGATSTPAAKPATTRLPAASATSPTNSTTRAAQAAAKPAVAGSLVAEAKKRLSSQPHANCSATTGAKHSSSPSLVSVPSHASSSGTATAPSKEVEELKSKLALSEQELTQVKAHQSVLEEKIAELSEKTGSAGSKEDGSDHAAALEAAKVEFASELEAMNKQIAEIQAKLTVAESELEAHKTKAVEAAETKDVADVEIKFLQQKLGLLESDYQAKLGDSEASLRQAEEKHAARTEELKEIMSAEHKAAVEAIEAKHAEQLQSGNTAFSASREKEIVNLQTTIYELTASKLDLEQTCRQKLAVQTETVAAKLSALEAEIEELKAKLEMADQVAENAKADAEVKRTSVVELESKVAELEAKLVAFQEEAAKSVEALAELQKIIDSAKEESGSKDVALTNMKEEAEKMKEQHAVQLRQISKDYEAEISNLRKEAHFKRKLLELEPEHEKLAAASAKATEEHAKALAAAKSEYEAAVEALEKKEGEHQKALEALQASHADELIAVKGEARQSTLDWGVQELDALKTSHSKHIAILKDESAATLEKELATMKASHEEVLSGIQTGHAETLERLKKAHDEEKEKLLASHANEKKQLLANHAEELSTGRFTGQMAFAEQLKQLQNYHDDEKEQLRASHAGALAAEKSAGEDTMAEQLAALRKKLKAEHGLEVSALLTQLEEAKAIKTDFDNAGAKLANLEAQHATAHESNKKLDEVHQQETEKLLQSHQQAQGEIKSAGYADAHLLTVEVQAKHAQALEHLQSHHATASKNHINQIKALEASKIGLEKVVTLVKSQCSKAQEQLDSLDQQVAHVTMDKVTTEAELDTAKRSAIDLVAVKEQLAKSTGSHEEVSTLKAAHEKALVSAAEEANKAVSELTSVREKLSLLIKEIEGHRLKNEAESKRGEADDNDLHDATTKMVEEAHEKMASLDKELKRDAKRISELEALIKVKDIEIAEARATSAASRPFGLTAGRHAGNEDESTVSTEGEGELDTAEDSSAALALIAKARMTAGQLFNMDQDMKDSNYRMLKSISDAKSG